MNQLLNNLCLLGCFGVLAVFGFIVIFSRSRMPKQRNRQEAELLKLQKELGLTPYTNAELHAMKQEARRQFNENARTTAFWTGSKTYRDFDGNEKSL